MNGVFEMVLRVAVDGALAGRSAGARAAGTADGPGVWLAGPGARLAGGADCPLEVPQQFHRHGTITVLHAIGCDHRLWYGQQRPQPFAAALRAAKAAVDPHGILNPGVIIDP